MVGSADAGLMTFSSSPGRQAALQGPAKCFRSFPGGLGLTPAVPKPSPYFAYADYARLLANPKSPCKQQGGLGVRGDLSDVDQPALGRQGHGLGAADGVELFQNSLHVILHRKSADLKNLPDLRVSFASRKPTHDFDFAL